VRVSKRRGVRVTGWARALRTAVAVVLAASVVVVVGAPVGGAKRLAPSSPAVIDHVVVLMQENRSADHYLGRLHFEGQPHFDPEPPGSSNPDPTNPTGPPVKVFHKTDYCEVTDLNHSWSGTHDEWDAGKMDGFTTANANALVDPTGARAMGYYDASDLPFYNALYNTFATGESYFSSVLGPTFPNRFYLLAGTSFGHIRNDFPPAGGFEQRTIFNLLDEAHVTWKIYYAQFPFGALFSYVANHAPGNVVPISQYYADAAAGQLPQVSFVDPIFLGSPNVENDEHPPANVQVGERFVSDAIHALFTSPNWSSSALFLTYDEHGGFFDRAAPPPAPVPDDIPPMLQPGDVPAAFDRYGIRVPAVVVSPYARSHFVSGVVHDHTSILRFIETRFGLPALTNRDANADPMLEFFDFSHAAFAQPPTLPPAPIDAAQAARCAATPANTGTTNLG
jgi:phospholipase C